MENSSIPTQQINSGNPSFLNLNPKNFMQFRQLIILFFVLIVIAALSAILFFFVLSKDLDKVKMSSNTPLKINTASSGSGFVKPSISPDKTVVLPISQNNPQVSSVMFYYEIESTLKELKDIPDGKQLITNIDDSSLPPFTFTPKTGIVFLLAPFSFKEAQLSDLKPGTKVQIILNYNLKNNSWIVNQVQILGETD